MGPLITEYHWIEINITFHLIYNTMFYPSWFLSYKGKTEPPLLWCCLTLRNGHIALVDFRGQGPYYNAIGVHPISVTGEQVERVP